jgi:hypothetical protein
MIFYPSSHEMTKLTPHAPLLALLVHLRVTEPKTLKTALDWHSFSMITVLAPVPGQINLSQIDKKIIFKHFFIERKSLSSFCCRL